MSQTSWIVRVLWLIPVLPMLAAGFSALMPKERRRASAMLAIGSMSVSLVLALIAFVETLSHPARQVVNFPWMQFGTQWVNLGWLLDPLAAVMLVMVTFVGLLIFIYSLATWPTTKTSHGSSVSCRFLQERCSA